MSLPVSLGVICFAASALALCRRLRASGQAFALLSPGVDSAELAPQAHATLAQLFAALPAPRTIWLLEPELPLAPVFPGLLQSMSAGDVIVDAGFCSATEAMQRERQAQQQGVGYVDVGIALNQWGAHYGFAILAGGTVAALQQAADGLNALAPLPQRGWLHCGPAGSGLFIRSLQRAIESAVMHSISQAHQNFDPQQTLQAAEQQLAPLWRQGGELRQKLAAQAAAYLCHIDPDRPFTAFFPPLAEHGALLPHPPPHSWPALELARIIQFASSSSQHFEQQIVNLLRNYPDGFGSTPGNDA